MRRPTDPAYHIRGEITAIQPHRAKPYQNEAVPLVSRVTYVQFSAQNIQIDNQHEQLSAQDKLHEGLMGTILHNKSSRAESATLN